MCFNVLCFDFMQLEILPSCHLTRDPLLSEHDDSLTNAEYAHVKLQRGNDGYIIFLYASHHDARHALT